MRELRCTLRPITYLRSAPYIHPFNGQLSYRTRFGVNHKSHRTVSSAEWLRWSRTGSRARVKVVWQWMVALQVACRFGRHLQCTFSPRILIESSYITAGNRDRCLMQWYLGSSECSSKIACYSIQQLQQGAQVWQTKDGLSVTVLYNYCRLRSICRNMQYGN